MRLGVVSILFFCIVTCYAQVPNVEIQKENSCFYVNNQLIGNLNYIITNKEDVPIWLWFSKDNISSLNNFQKIRKYFKVLPSQGDSSYYQWMCDGNVTSFTASLFFSFGKVIQPKEDFYISFIYQDIDISNMVLFIDAHLNIVLEEEIVKQCPGIENKAVKDQFTFHPSVITIPWDNFVEAL